MTAAREVDSVVAGTRLAGGAGISFAGKVAGRVGHILVQVLFARLLGMEDFGRYALGMTIVRMLGSIAPLGMIRAVVVFGAKYWRVDPARFRGVLASTVGFTFTSSVLLAGAVAGFAGPLAGFFGASAMDQGIVVAFAPLIVAFAMMRMLVETTRISQRMQFGVVAEDILHPIVALLVFAACHLAGMGLSGAILATGLAYLASCLLATFFCRRLYAGDLVRGGGVRLEARELARFAGPTSASVLFGVCCTMIDRLVVGAWRPPEEMALYQAASQVSVAFTIILGSFTTIFAPMAARYRALGQHEELRSLVRQSTNWGLYLAVPLFVFIASAPDSLLALTFGDAYRTGATTLVVLATGQLVNAATGSVGVLLITAGRQATWLALTVAALVTSLATALVLTPRWGIEGAAIGNLVNNIVLFGGGVLVARRTLDIWPYEKRSAKIAAGGVVAGLVCAAAGALPLAEVAALHIVLVAGCVAATTLAVHRLLGFEEEDRALARSLVARMRSRHVG